MGSNNIGETREGHVSSRSPPGLGRKQGWRFRADSPIRANLFLHSMDPNPSVSTLPGSQFLHGMRENVTFTCDFLFQG